MSFRLLALLFALLLTIGCQPPDTSTGGDGASQSSSDGDSSGDGDSDSNTTTHIAPNLSDSLLV